MRRSLSLILILASAATVAACATEPRRPHFRPGMGMRHGGGPGGPGGPGMGMGRGLFVSPAGEPFRRTEGGPEPLRAWFDQADKDHDGALTWPEFEADFVRYFAVLDADHDGEIGPDEVAHYESSIFPEMASRGYGGGGPGMGGGQGMRGGGGMGGGHGGMRGGGMRGGGMRGGGMRQGGGRPGGGGVGMAGAARFGLLPIAHPIMDADLDFNRGVSLAEFRQAAAHRFAMLNTANTGRLSFDQLVQIRAQAMQFRVRRAEPQTEEERRAAIPVPGE